jgi:hypothetical protein
LCCEEAPSWLHPEKDATRRTSWLCYEEDAAFAELEPEDLAPEDLAPDEPEPEPEPDEPEPEPDEPEPDEPEPDEFDPAAVDAEVEVVAGVEDDESDLVSVEAGAPFSAPFSALTLPARESFR